MKNMRKIFVLLMLAQFLYINNCYAIPENNYHPANADTARTNYPNDTGNPKTNYLNDGSNPNDSYYSDRSSNPENNYYSDSTIPSKKNYLNDLSTIEKIFNKDKDKNSENILLQFGYDNFTGIDNVNTKSKLPKDYRLNVGDRVNVYFWGDTVDMMTISGSPVIKPENSAIVDKDGNLFIQGVGAIPAEDSTVSEIEKRIYSILSPKFNGFKIKIAVNESGIVPIMVLGNVKKPGLVYLNSNSNVLDALNAAGGVRKDGSLRSIIYTSGKNQVTLDFYDLLLNGSYKTIKIKNGDTIVIKPIGKVVALQDGVKTPGIYEFKQGENFKKLIGYAGGILPIVNQKSVQVETIDSAKGQRVVNEINYDNLGTAHPKDGDILSFKEIFDQSENFISLEGNIKHPGRFQYHKNMRMSDILKSKDELLNRTYWDQAVIVRISGSEKERITVPFSLSDFFNGTVNPELKPQDIIKVIPSTTMADIEVSGCVSNPGLIPFNEGMTLKDVLGIINFDSNDYNNIQPVEPAEYKITVSKNAINPDDVVAEISSDDNLKDDIKGTLKIVYLYELLTQNKEELNLELKPGDKILFRPITEQEKSSTVEILGYVNNPGVYKIKPGMRLQDVLRIAGGVKSNGYLRGIVFQRPYIYNDQIKAIKELELNSRKNDLDSLRESIKNNANVKEKINIDMDQYYEAIKKESDITSEKAKSQYSRIALNIQDNSLDELSDSNNLEISDGDKIYVPQKPQHIIVVGEVKSQSTIVYNPDKSAKFYIDNVGGFTKEADKRGVYLVKYNGITKVINRLSATIIEPGDSIIVPAKKKGLFNWSTIVKDISQVGINALGTIFVLTKI